MGIIRDIVHKHIRDYYIAKTGDWEKSEPLPPINFTKDEIYLMGDDIVKEIEGLMSDKFLRRSPKC